jgi:hypothetical protein
VIEMSLEDIARLELFNEKAKRLLDSRFVQFALKEKKFSFEVRMERGKEVETSKILPNGDAIDAFVLTFRYFVQNNERCSFGNLAKTYSKPSTPLEMKDEYFKARKNLNDYLDSSASVKIGDEPLSRRRVLDIFVYGGLAHAHPEKKEMFDNWMKNPLFSGFFEVEFASILISVLNIIQYVAKLNERVIEEFKKNMH